MLVDNPELLRTWLTDNLRPLCDADPAALSKYVLALIKKDKPESELRQTMVQQMDVFLQNETTPFIEKLFKTVKSKEYENLGKDDSTPVADENSRAETELTNTEQEDDIAKEKNGHAPDDDEEKENSGEQRRSKEKSLDSGKGRKESKSPARVVKEVESGDVDEKRKSRGASPPPGGRRVRAPRSPPRRYREYSPTARHDRRPPARRRSRSPIRRNRSRSPPHIRHRPRSMERYRPEARVSPPPRRASSRDSTPTRDEGGYNPTIKRIRCRDYDEKGFCLKGDLCKYDHGNDAVVLEDSTKALGGYIPPAGQPPIVEPYVPMTIGGIPFPPPVMTVPPPSYGGGLKRGHDGNAIQGEPPHKRFDHSRLGLRGGRGRGGRGGGRGGAAGGIMLAVRNIPAEHNNITMMNAHFAKFGNLQNIQINFEGDPCSALLTFSTTQEAENAFNSAEAVLNNRFIKVFRHTDKSVKDRIGNNIFQQGDNITKTISNEDNDKAKEQKQIELLAIQKNQEMLQTKAALIKESEEKRKEAIKQQESLRKSKQDLLEGLIEEQKGLIARLEKGKNTLKPVERKTIMTLFDELSKSIEKAKEDIKNTLNATGFRTRTQQEIKKELLDAEMELFNSEQNQSHDATKELQEKVNRLRLEAAKTGLLPTSRPPRGRGGYRARGYRGSMSPRGYGARGRGGRGRGFTLSPGTNTLDRRPSRILVSGYELEEKDELIQHFEKFGEILEIMEDEATPSVILKYKTRKMAEMAMAQGKNYNDRVLQLSWYNQGTPEKDQIQEQYEVEEEVVEDDYTPPQHDYLPPGLQEHEDSLGSPGGEGAGGASLLDDELDNEEGLEEEDEEVNHDLLDDEDEEEQDDDKGWKRRSNQDED